MVYGPNAPDQAEGGGEAQGLPDQQAEPVDTGGADRANERMITLL